MWAGLERARTPGLAAEMSFWLFLSLLPLAAVGGFVTARLATTSSSITGTVLAAVPPEVRGLFSTQLERVAAWHGGTVAPIAAVTFVWLASTGVQSTFDALEVQAGRSRPWWKKRLLAIGTCIALSIGLAVLALLGAGLDWMQAFAGREVPAYVLHLEHGLPGQALRWSAAALVAVGMTAGLYRAAIPRDVRARFPILPGALLAVGMQATLGWGYGLYVTSLGGGGDAYQAGLAVVAVTLMTLWLFSLALLLGAQLNRALAERAQNRPAPQAVRKVSSVHGDDPPGRIRALGVARGARRGLRRVRRQRQQRLPVEPGARRRQRDRRRRCGWRRRLGVVL
ncbi:MAG TPA: YihY/virulence factor BrkB family protein [Polyangiaceae bacterium]|jgi:membrane protein